MADETDAKDYIDEHFFHLTIECNEIVINEIARAMEEYHEFKKANDNSMQRFEIEFEFTGRSDVIIHKEIIEAETEEEALNKLYRKHNYKILWRTINKLNGA